MIDVGAGRGGHIPSLFRVGGEPKYLLVPYPHFWRIKKCYVFHYRLEVKPKAKTSLFLHFFTLFDAAVKI